MKDTRVVLLLSDARTRGAVARRLETQGVRVVEAGGVLAAVEEIASSEVDVLVLDFTWRAELMEGLIDAVRQISPRIRVITHAARSEPWHGGILECGTSFYAAGMDPMLLSEAILAVAHWKVPR